MISKEQLWLIICLIWSQSINE